MMPGPTARDVDIGWPKGLRGSEQISESITTAAAYANALDLDCQGMVSLSVDIKNTHGTNSITVTAVIKESDYTNGQDVTLNGYPVTLAPSEEGLVKRSIATARLTIQAVDETGGSHGTCTVTGHINRL